MDVYRKNDKIKAVQFICYMINSLEKKKKIFPRPAGGSPRARRAAPQKEKKKKGEAKGEEK